MNEDLKDILKMAVLTIILFIAYIAWVCYCTI